MKNFTYSIPTVVHFGEGQIKKLGAEIAARARRVLVVYGGGRGQRHSAFPPAGAPGLPCSSPAYPAPPSPPPRPR